MFLAYRTTEAVRTSENAFSPAFAKTALLTLGSFAPARTTYRALQATRRILKRTVLRRMGKQTFQEIGYLRQQQEILKPVALMPVTPPLS